MGETETQMIVTIFHSETMNLVWTVNWFTSHKQI